LSSTDSLGRLERLILLAILRLGVEAYGVLKEIEERTGRHLNPGSVYPILKRLEEVGAALCAATRGSGAATLDKSALSVHVVRLRRPSRC